MSSSRTRIGSHSTTNMRIWACLLLLPTLLHADLSTHRCGVPRAELVRYGKIGQSDKNYLEISCYTGITQHLSCDQNNQWTPFSSGSCPVPTCDWNKLPAKNDTLTRTGGNELNDTVTFRCRAGLLGGPILFRCMKKNGRKKTIKFHWKPQNRTAEGTRLKRLSCTEPDDSSCQYRDAPHRQIVSKELTYGLHRIVEDDVLTLGCDNGYKLNGDSIVFCESDGIWYPPELPQCEEIRCEVPEREHLTAQLDGYDTPLPAGTNMTNYQKVAWECEKGYRLTGATLVTCNKDWQRNIPKCQAVRCPPIAPPEHGVRIVRGRGRVGSSVTAECNDGYTLLGTRRRFCTTAGSWNGTLQICDNGRSTCRSPGRPVGGMRHGERYNKGDKVTFSCSTGHTLLGSTERVCLDNGEWTGDETRCMAANEHMTKEEAFMRLGSGLAQLSEKSIDTKLQKDKLNDLMGKEVLLGKNKMKDMNPNQRATIKELRDKGGIDVYFVLDTSGSIPQAAKSKSVDIIKKLVRLVGVSAEKSGTGFGFLAFDSEVWRTVAVGEQTDTNAIIRFLDRFREAMFDRPTGGTAPATAFTKLQALIQTRIYANMESMKDRSSAIILLSDGIKNEGGDPVTIRDKLVKQANLLNHDIHVYCIGVGNTNLELLNQLATNGTDYLVYLQDLSELQEVVGKIYNGNSSFGQCGVQGHKTTYTEDTSIMWAKAGTWRWVGGLYFYRLQPPDNSDDQFKGSEFICGVSLISKGPHERQSVWALTAAHCVHNIGARKLMVKFGSLTSNSTLDGTVVHVESIFKHADYSPGTLLNDIALLKLKAQIPFAHDVRPVCLHKPSEDPIKVNTMAKMTGWGYLSMQNRTISPTLKQLSVKIQTDESCTQSTQDMVQTKFVRPFNFCAGNVTVAGKLIDACKKDSGSPLVQCQEQGLKRVCTQIGIVSFGEKCGLPGKYGVYTNITTYFNWINGTMHQP